MLDALTTTSIKDILRFPFQGARWQNHFWTGVGLVFACTIIPIVPIIFVYGYFVKVMRIAIAGEKLELPVWNDWGKLGLDGLKLLVISFIYTLPGSLVYIGGMFIYFLGFLVIPMASASKDTSTMEPILVVLMFVVMAVFFLSLAIGMLFYILGTLPLPVVIGHFVANDRLSAAFEVRGWWKLLVKNKLNYFTSLVVVVGLGSIIALGSMILYYSLVLCCLLPLVASIGVFYISLVAAVLFGITYRESREKIETGAV